MQTVKIAGDQRHLVTKQTRAHQDTYIKNRLNTILTNEHASRIELELLFDPDSLTSSVRITAIHDIWGDLPTETLEISEVPLIYDFLARNEYFSIMFRQCRDKFNVEMKEHRKLAAQARVAMEKEEDRYRDVRAALFVHFFLVFKAEEWVPIAYGTAPNRQEMIHKLDLAGYEQSEYSLVSVMPSDYFKAQRRTADLKRI